jgi:hypothetical protein
LKFKISLAVGRDFKPSLRLTLLSKLTLERGVKRQLLAKSKKARAVDDKTGTQIDVLQG